MNETYEEFDTRQSTGSTSTRTFSEAQERRMSGDYIQTLVNEVFDSSYDDYTEGNQNEFIAKVTVHTDPSAAIGAENDANAISTQTPVIAAAASALGAQKVNDKATVVKTQNVKETSGKKSSSPTKLRKRFASLTEGLTEKAREVMKRLSLSSPGRSSLNNSPKMRNKIKRIKMKSKVQARRKPKNKGSQNNLHHQNTYQADQMYQGHHHLKQQNYNSPSVNS